MVGHESFSYVQDGVWISFNYVKLSSTLVPMIENDCSLMFPYKDSLKILTFSDRLIPFMRFRAVYLRKYLESFISYPINTNSLNGQDL